MDGLGKELSESEAIQAWQYLESVGGSDKDRMVTASTWLLAFSGAIIGYSVTEGFGSNKYMSVLVLGILGVFVSVLAACVTLTYGGYANRNWARAHILAQQKGWNDLAPLLRSRAGLELEEQRKTRRSIWPLNWAEELSRPEDPLSRLAPIFHWFFWFAVSSAGTHLAIITISLTRLCGAS